MFEKLKQMVRLVTISNKKAFRTFAKQNTKQAPKKQTPSSEPQNHAHRTPNSESMPPPMNHISCRENSGIKQKNLNKNADISNP